VIRECPVVVCYLFRVFVMAIFATCVCGLDIGVPPEAFGVGAQDLPSELDLGKDQPMVCWSCGEQIDTRMKIDGGQAYEIDVSDTYEVKPHPLGLLAVD